MEKQIKISSGISLSKLIDNVIRETQQRAALERNAANERAVQQKFMKEEDEPSADVGKKEEKSSATMSDEIEKLKTGNVSVEDIIEKLNSIRAGKSFKDEEISMKFSEYFDSLSKPEKVALLAFLKGISQIVSGEVEPDKAIEPSDKEPDVTMKKGEKEKTIKIEPTIVKKPESGEKRPTGEDTSGPVPIKPKK